MTRLADGPWTHQMRMPRGERQRREPSPRREPERLGPSHRWERVRVCELYFGENVYKCGVVSRAVCGSASGPRGARTRSPQCALAHTQWCERGRHMKRHRGHSVVSESHPHSTHTHTKLPRRDTTPTQRTLSTSTSASHAWANDVQSLQVRMSDRAYSWWWYW